VNHCCRSRSVVLLILRDAIDELITIYVVLRMRYLDETRLKFYLDRLVVSLEVQAYGFQSRPSNGQESSKEISPSRSEDTLWSTNIDTCEDATEVILQGNEQDPESYMLAIWRTTVPLSG